MAIRSFASNVDTHVGGHGQTGAHDELVKTSAAMT
jgi:hypothetical protein